MYQITPFLYLVTLPNVCDCSDQFQSVTSLFKKRWDREGGGRNDDFIFSYFYPAAAKLEKREKRTSCK